MMQMNGCLASMEMKTRQREALALASRIRQAQAVDQSNNATSLKVSSTARIGGLAALVRRLFVPADTSCSSRQV